MASGFLALLDDVASILDDVAVLTKVAAKKTSGVIGDDLALNAQQLTGVSPERELPIIWAVAKGGFKNKLILVPLALLITAYASWLVIPLLMVGGAYLCFEGVEKVLEKVFPHPHEIKPALSEAEKIRGAIRTDFILSAEIIIISLSSIASGSLLSQVLTLSFISILMTIFIYGLVGLIVKLDDIGLKLLVKKNGLLKVSGKALVNGTPYLMKTLGVVGTLAMFLVGGGIISHGIHAIGNQILTLAQNLPVPMLWTTLMEGVVGVGAGLVIVGAFTLVKKLKKQVS